MLQQLTTFVRIAELGSISGAARALGLSAAMASRHLVALEEELDVTLVRRTTRRLELTEAGRELLARSKKLLADFEEARAALRPGEGPAGEIVLGVPGWFGPEALVPLLPKLLSANPRLSVDLRFEDKAFDLVFDGVDLAIRLEAPPDSPVLVSRRLASFDRVLCASPAFLRRHGPIDVVDALSGVPSVVQESRPASWSLETARGSQDIAVDGRVRTTNIAAARAAILAGLGIGWLPLSGATVEDLRRGALVRVLEETKMAPMTLHAIYHRQSRSVLAVRKVIDFFLRELTSGASPVRDAPVTRRA